MHSGGLKKVSQSIYARPPAVLEPCCVRPTQTQLEVLQGQIRDNSIKSALSLFVQLSRANSIIVCSDLTEMLSLADRIEGTRALSSLSFSDKYIFTCAPVSINDEVIQDFIAWVISYSRQIPVELREGDYQAFLSAKSTSEDSLLNAAENEVKSLTLYHWLARKKRLYFPSLEKCEDLRDRMNTFIENSLKRKGLHRKCPHCSKKMPLHHMHKLCDACFRKNLSN
jgi:hypothetical protein